MDKITMGYIVQFAACIALTAAVLWSGNTVKALLIAGVAGLVVGRYIRTPRRS